jgi:hypothetical protein
MAEAEEFEPPDLAGLSLSRSVHRGGSSRLTPLVGSGQRLLLVGRVLMTAALGVAHAGQGLRCGVADVDLGGLAGTRWSPWLKGSRSRTMWIRAATAASRD